MFKLECPYIGCPTVQYICSLLAYRHRTPLTIPSNPLQFDIETIKYVLHIYRELYLRSRHILLGAVISPVPYIASIDSSYAYMPTHILALIERPDYSDIFDVEILLEDINKSTEVLFQDKYIDRAIVVYDVDRFKVLLSKYLPILIPLNKILSIESEITIFSRSSVNHHVFEFKPSIYLSIPDIDRVQDMVSELKTRTKYMGIYIDPLFDPYTIDRSMSNTAMYRIEVNDFINTILQNYSGRKNVSRIVVEVFSYVSLPLIEDHSSLVLWIPELSSDWVKALSICIEKLIEIFDKELSIVLLDNVLAKTFSSLPIGTLLSMIASTLENYNRIVNDVRVYTMDLVERPMDIVNVINKIIFTQI